MPDSARKGFDRPADQPTAMNGLAVAAVFVLVLLPLMYFLSVGPAILLFNNGYVNEDVVEVIYFPLVWLHENTPLGPIIEWYVELWHN